MITEEWMANAVSAGIAAFLALLLAGKYWKRKSQSLIGYAILALGFALLTSDIMRVGKSLPFLAGCTGILCGMIALFLGEFTATEKEPDKANDSIPIPKPNSSNGFDNNEMLEALASISMVDIDKKQK
ncbi:MAG: hypothetical protein SNJ70_00280 [Armatimonadota bacterium]